MNVNLSLFSLFLIFFILIILAPVRINIEYLRENNKEKIRIKLILFWGLVKFNLPAFKQQKHRKHNNEKSLHPIKTLKDILLLFRVMKKIIICDKFYWTTAFGLPDAAQTGVLSGFIWSIKGNILALVKRFFIFEDQKPEIEVLPDFKKVFFFVEIKGYFRVYPYRLLKAVIQIIYQKVRGGRFNWKIIQSRA